VSSDATGRSLVFEFHVEHTLHGTRIDTFLSRHLRNHSAWRLMRLVRAGLVQVEHITADETVRVFAGQSVRVELIEPPDHVFESDPAEVPILYSDPWMLVVDKPAGLIAHPTGEYQINSLANVLQTYVDRLTEVRGLLRPGIVHRLDRQTSGLMVVALTHHSHRNLSMGFEAGRVSKSYMALTEGVLGHDRGSIKHAIGRAVTGRHVLMSCRGDAIEPRPSQTNYEVIERFANHTLVKTTPLTGRNHQIRVHMAHLGHPLIGDAFYKAHGQFHPLRPKFVPPVDDPEAEDPDPGPIETGYPIRRHALHACRLAFAHPITGLWMEFHSDLPDDFRETIEVLRTGIRLSIR
jgi:23S rRNA pseudouridine1911/1915/1917 synthase